MTLADLRRTQQRITQVLRRIIGAPDYERYVAHVRECHAGAVPMTRREFERARLEDRYNQPGNRCC